MKKIGLLIFVCCLAMANGCLRSIFPKEERKSMAKDSMTIYRLTDPTQQLSFQQILNNPRFEKTTESELNFGISLANHWLKVVCSTAQVPPQSPRREARLEILTIVPDTIEVYEQKEDGNYQKAWIGEAFASQHRFLQYHFTGGQRETVLYLKIKGDGQPLALPIRLMQNEETDVFSIFFSALLVGIVFFILMMNLVLYVGTSEKLYFYFFFFNLFSLGNILYFDGFVKLFLIPDSCYWNNQFIALSLCGSFLSVNYYFYEFLNIKQHQPNLTRYFRGINVLFILILGLSFFRPMGFVWYIRCHILMVAPEALLLFVSLVAVRRKEADYFMIQLVSIGLVLVFGFVVQLYYLGFLPVHLLTRYAVHGMILPQIVIQTFALGKRFAILTKERLALHNALLHASEKYSQSLIKTLEAERKRLSAEFHDSIGQNLLVIRNRLLLMIKKLPPSISPPLEALADLTSETLDEIREISQNLRPTTLDTIGLTASLHNMMQRLVRATEIEIQFDCPQNIDEMVIKDLEINVYRILQELMNNVLKHSKARRVRVTVVPKDHALRLVVEDDGVGFDRNKLDTIAVSGMNSIRERVRILKGELTINSTPNQGTMVQIKIPCPPPV